MVLRGQSFSALLDKWSLFHACYYESKLSRSCYNLGMKRENGDLNVCVVGGRQRYPKVNMIAG